VRPSRRRYTARGNPRGLRRGWGRRFPRLCAASRVLGRAAAARRGPQSACGRRVPHPRPSCCGASLTRREAAIGRRCWRHAGACTLLSPAQPSWQGVGPELMRPRFLCLSAPPLPPRARPATACMHAGGRMRCRCGCWSSAARWSASLAAARGSRRRGSWGSCRRSG
jgi:hypothetical protein